MSGEPADSPDRLRAALRRHGLLRRPRALRRFIRSRGLRFIDGNAVQLFDSGAEGLASMLDAIRGAQSRIALETYILRPDRTGTEFRDALAEQARRRLAVRLLYDAFGSMHLDQGWIEPLRRAGADVVAFNPLRGFYPRWLPRRRDHRKLLVVDGRRAYLGGLNIGDEYNAPAGGQAGWRDTHLQVEGPVVRDLEAIFLESWFRADGPDLPWAELLGRAPEPCGTVRCAVLADGPVYRRRMMRDLLILGLRTARAEVRLTSPYFAPDRKVLRSIEDGSRRGVSVRLLLAGATDHPILRRAAHSLLPRLLKAGAGIAEYHEHMLHAKTAVFDDNWAVIGTSNMDRQSFEHSYEINLIVERGELPRQLAELFERDMARSVRIDQAHLAARTISERVLDAVSALVLRVI